MTSVTVNARRHSLPGGLRPPAALWVTLGIFVVFALVVPRFATLGNFENLLRVAAILGIAACGQAIVLILGGIEFSFGASAALASVLIVLSEPAIGTPLAFAVGAGSCLAVGAVNGILIARFDLAPFLVTLGMLMVCGGLAASIAGGLPIDAPSSPAFAWPARGRILGLPVPLLAALASLVLLFGLLARTHLGRLWYLCGSNPVAARLSGLPVRRVLFSGYLAASGFCAIAALILTSRVGSGQPNLAPNLSFETIAACAIGGIPLAGGQGRASQVACGVLVIAMMNNAVVLTNLPVAWQYILIACVILGSVLLQRGWPMLRDLASVVRGRDR